MRCCAAALETTDSGLGRADRESCVCATCAWLPKQRTSNLLLQIALQMTLPKAAAASLPRTTCPVKTQAEGDLFPRAQCLHNPMTCTDEQQLTDTQGTGKTHVCRRPHTLTLRCVAVTSAIVSPLPQQTGSFQPPSLRRPPAPGPPGSGPASVPGLPPPADHPSR